MEKDLHGDREGKEEIEDEEQVKGDVVESTEMKWDETAGCTSKKYVERDREEENKNMKRGGKMREKIESFTQTNRL